MYICMETMKDQNSKKDQVRMKAMLTEGRVEVCTVERKNVLTTKVNDIIL